MNSIYKVLADCAALLVVSSGCAVVKVMTGCEKKKKKKKKKLQFMKNATAPLWARPCCPPPVPRERLTMAKSVRWCLPSPEKSTHLPSRRRNSIRLKTSITLHEGHFHLSHPCFSLLFWFFFFCFFSMLTRGLIDVVGDIIWPGL